VIYAPIYCLRLSIEREQVFDEIHDDVEDVLRNLVSVYGNDSSTEEMDRLHVKGDEFYRANTNAMACLLKFKAIGAPIIVAFVVGVVLRCCHLIERGKMETGTFVTIFMITISMVSSLTWLVSLIKSSTLDFGIIVETQRVFSKALENTKILSTSCGRGVVPATGIGLSHVTFLQKGTQRPVIDGVSVHFESNERTVITGDIGSGKSTILKLLMAFVQPDRGDLYINGRWYSDMSPSEIRKNIAFMPQEAILFDRTIAENILYGSQKNEQDGSQKTEKDGSQKNEQGGYEKTEQDVVDLIEELGVSKEFVNKKDGIHASVGKNGSRLSGGQRQLVWIIRIIMRDPEVVIMDEPTSSMDSDTKEIFLRVLETRFAEKTIIMVSHDPALMKTATRRLEWTP
jgi:ABC-type multidrug transport system fused ATPase/permease subunit